MATQGRIPASARFGPYEISFEPPELRKYGYRLKLSGQALQVLLLLAEEPGRVVTREELQRELWPNAAYGDFEHGLNAAVNRLRETLNDSATVPKYIETIPRRGYRFIASFESEPTPTAPQLAEVKPLAPLETEIRHRLNWLAISSAAAFFALSATLALLYLRPAPVPRVLTIIPVTHDGMQKADPVTDGELLYFSEGNGGHNWKLFQVPVAGGDTLALGSYAKPRPYEISRNRSELLAGVDWDGLHKMEPEITIIPLPNGPPRRLGIFATWAAWSHDEKRVIYATPTGKIFSATRGAANIQKLAEVEGFISHLRLSPDGTHVRFTLEDPAQTRSELWEMSADGQNLHRLFSNRSASAADCCGSWTPDGRYYVFERVQNDGLFQRGLWAIRESRSPFHPTPPEPVPITIGPLDWLNPIVSRDGRTVYAVGSQSRGELVHYNLRTKEFDPFPGTSLTELDFSRDGQWVTFVSTPNRLLWRCRIDGSERLQLTDTAVQAALPRWSPDGKQIAFMAREPGKRWKINLVSAQGGALRPILDEDRNEVDPTWGSDNNSLAFGRLYGSTGAEKQAIFVVDLNTKKVAELPGSQNLFSPRWSPDGRYMAAIQGDLSRLMIFDFHTRTWADWVATAVNFPAWSADSKWIYFDTAKAAEPAYYRVRVGETAAERLFSLESIPLFWGEWGTWSGLAPDGSGLFVRDASAQEIYALKMQWP
jgi:Tol biopolymer transport system component/DNA-binding winged helix-turn-helix (wHTH) protein